MPKRILLADDSITIQKVVELTFSDGDYEVTAVNNGSKAVAKLAEMRPDIILSDIIMPEKNGYEVCEFVKSHPEYRNIPVVLLTGTFEPFDPDRAEKAGCDAVVTKPFESQSLIHKVEELISQAQSSAAASPASTPQPEATSPWMEEAPATPPPASPFSSATSAIPALSPDAFGHGSDIFGAAPAQDASTSMPFDTPASESSFAPPAADNQFASEEPAPEPMSFGGSADQAQDAAPEAEAPASPWDESPKAFGDPRPSSPFDSPAPSFEPPADSFDSFASPAPEPESESPFGAPPPADDFSGETRAFPRMSFDDMQAAATSAETAAEPSAPAAPETSPWEQDSPAFGGETRAFEKMSFGDLQQQSTPAPDATTAAWSEPETPAFGSEPPAFEEEPPAFSTEPPAFSSEPSVFTPESSFEGETRAFQKMSFDDLQKQAQPEEASTPADSSNESQPEASSWDRTPEPVESLWASPAEPESETEPASADAEPASAPFSDEADSFDASPSPEDLPFATETTSPSEPEAWGASAAGAASAAEARAENDEPAVSPAVLSPDAPAMPIAARGDLSDDQVDRIARRVVELMSDQVIRNIAWEVIPDVAEMIVKERIRQLESEA